jgi:hypothetical protein
MTRVAQPGWLGTLTSVQFGPPRSDIPILLSQNGQRNSAEASPIRASSLATVWRGLGRHLAARNQLPRKRW